MVINVYLKEIVANGFKSFADKIDIKLDNKTTCIVGPNGSGKSNVVDAVRWVLGEQSVKSLRGDNLMSDVIFAGSKNRKAFNMASVELIFDNSDHYLNLEYTDISIKRKAYRNGENEYYLNGQKCRLKDILNLMLDTGIGKESFNIISQGEVDKIISNSSLDRRIIIEEVAGVLKYKKRKEEALKKLGRTHDNMNRVQDIIIELEKQVIPLKSQSEKALEYLDNKKKLENLEIALLAYDIYNDTSNLEILKSDFAKVSSLIVDVSSSTTSNDSDLLKKNIMKDKLEDKLNSLNGELLQVVEEVEKLNSEKLLLEEKEKNKENRDRNEERLSVLFEEKERLVKDVSLIDAQISSTKINLDDINVKKSNILKEREEFRSNREYLMSDFSKVDQEIISFSNKKKSILFELESSSFIPKAVLSVLNAKSLSGIYDIIGNVLSIDSKYTKALEIAISASKNFIITEDDESSKSAIRYLKDHNLGRATFFPLSVIKSRRVDGSILRSLENEVGFVGVLSDLVSYDVKYRNIIENQLGTILVADNIDVAVLIAKKINYRYKIVTLDGDVINVGGSLSGGSSSNYSKSSVTLRQELDFVEQKVTALEREKREKQERIDFINASITDLDDKLLNTNRKVMELEERLRSLTSNRSLNNDTLHRVVQEIESIDSVINNDAMLKIEKITQDYYSKVSRRDIIKNDIKSVSSDLSDIKDEIERLSADYKVYNQELRELEKNKNDLELKINRLDDNIDRMLRVLSEEYSMTYERAREAFHLDIEVLEAREKVNLYKSNIKRIGMVNLDSIEEYERVNNRYSFLLKQKGDLESAETSLVEIMDEMDGVIEEEFVKTFNAVNEEFSKVFRELFVGGNAYLKLTDEDNLLTTGIDIVASPPGKKLTSISLLSGGEKTLTAISLLFAILNVRTIPFCLFDEVEAALDEANVDQFGKYLDHYKDKTQFLIITHKKKTMEYANTLYGITMQESGVSKLVSVRLNDHIDSL